MGRPLCRPFIDGEAADPHESAKPRHSAALAASTQLTNQHRQFEGRCLAYHAVPGNLHRLQLFCWRLRWIWWRALSRRSQRSFASMARLNRLIARWIPVARVLHPYPMQHFDASHPRREPYA
jgi:hypothetical protein